MPVSFSNIPANMQRPLVHIEVDPSKAGTLSLVQAAVLIGVMLSTGTATADQPIAIASQAQANAAFGVGSQLANMFDVFFQNNIGARLYAIPVVEPVGGAKASGTITVTDAPTKAGTIPLFIAGRAVPVDVLGNETVDQTAAKINTAINAIDDLPVTSTVLAGVVTVTCNWKGADGEDIKLQIGYYGALGGEEVPTGFDATIVAMDNGSGVPVFTNAIAALGDDLYDYCCFPFTDATSLAAIAAEYGFSDAGRWGYDRQAYGTVFSAKRDSYANLVAWSATENSPVVSVMSLEATAPSPIWEVAAAYTAKAARAFLNDPARPLQSLTFEGILPARRGYQFNRSERHNMALTGLAIMAVTSDNKYMIEREVMLYQKNVYGQADTAYHDATTLHTLAYVLRRLTQSITSKYPRHKVANDGTRFGPGQAVVTPKTIKAELVAQYRLLEYECVVENVDAFKENLVVERNVNDPTRVDVLYGPDLVNGMRVFAVLAQFRLQYSTLTP